MGGGMGGGGMGGGGSGNTGGSGGGSMRYSQSLQRRRAQVREASRRFRERKKHEMGSLEERVAFLTHELATTQARLADATAREAHTALERQRRGGGDDEVVGLRVELAAARAATATVEAATVAAAQRSGRARRPMAGVVCTCPSLTAPATHCVLHGDGGGGETVLAAQYAALHLQWQTTNAAASSLRDAATAAVSALRAAADNATDAADASTGAAAAAETLAAAVAAAAAASEATDATAFDLPQHGGGGPALPAPDASPPAQMAAAAAAPAAGSGASVSSGSRTPALALWQTRVAPPTGVDTTRGDTMRGVDTGRDAMSVHSQSGSPTFPQTARGSGDTGGGGGGSGGGGGDASGIMYSRPMMHQPPPPPYPYGSEVARYGGMPGGGMAGGMPQGVHMVPITLANGAVIRVSAPMAHGMHPGMAGLPGMPGMPGLPHLHSLPHMGGMPTAPPTLPPPPPPPPPPPSAHPGMPYMPPMGGLPPLGASTHAAAAMAMAHHQAAAAAAAAAGGVPYGYAPGARRAAQPSVPPSPWSSLVLQALGDICNFATDGWWHVLTEGPCAVFTRPADLPVFSLKYEIVAPDVPAAALSRVLWGNFTDERIAREINPDATQRVEVLEQGAANNAVVRRRDLYAFPDTAREYVYVVHAEGELSRDDVLSVCGTLPPRTVFDSMPGVATEPPTYYIGILRSVQHPLAPLAPDVVRADMYEGWVVRSAFGGRGCVGVLVGQIDSKAGAVLPPEALTAAYHSIPRYAANTVRIAREWHAAVTAAAAGSAPPSTASSSHHPGSHPGGPHPHSAVLTSGPTITPLPLYSSPPPLAPVVAGSLVLTDRRAAPPPPPSLPPFAFCGGMCAATAGVASAPASTADIMPS